MMRRTTGEKAFNVLSIAGLLLLVVAMLIPILSVVSTSLVSQKEIAERRVVVLPQKLDFSAYRLIFRSSSMIINAYKITLFRVVVGTLVNMIFTYFGGYALARRDLPGRKALTMFFFFTMLFGGGLIPYYLVVKSVHLVNSIWVYILPQLISVWYLLLMRNFIMNIPLSLFESAEIDGASQLTMILRIVLPLSIPALATLSLFYAVFHWNSWWDAFLFVSEPRKQPVQLLLRNILAQATVQISQITGQINIDEVKPLPRAIQNATVVVATVPIICVYPFLQKYFIRGVMMGSIKG